MSTTTKNGYTITVLKVWIDARRYNGKCKGCGRRVSFTGRMASADVSRPSSHGGSSFDTVVVDAQGRAYEYPGYEAIVECTCGRSFYARPVQGTFNPGKECSAKCLAAIGVQCDCRCKGHNHGGAHAIDESPIAEVA